MTPRRPGSAQRTREALQECIKPARVGASQGWDMTDYNPHIYDAIPVKAYAALRSVQPRTVRDWIRKGWVSAIRTAGEHGDWRILVAKVSRGTTENASSAASVTFRT